MKEKDLLIQENQSLKQEIATLQKQFNEAVSFSSQMEEIYSQKSNLESQVRKLTNDKKELQQRLQINAKATEDLKKQFENEKNQIINLSLKEKEEIKDTNNQTIDELKQKINELKNEIEINKKDNSSDNNEKDLIINDILKYASDYFNCEIDDPDSLLSLFKKRKDELIEQKDDDSSKNILKIKKLIAKNKSLKKRIESLQQSNKLSTKDVSEQMIEMKNQNERQCIEINNLKQSNEKLLKENAKLSVDLQCSMKTIESNYSEQSLNLNKQNEVLSGQINQMKEENEKMKKRIKELIIQNNETKRINDELTNNKQNNQYEISLLTSDNAQLKNELNSFKEKSNKLQNDIVGLHKRIKDLINTGKELKDQLKEQTNENKKYGLGIKQITVTIENQGSEITSLSKQRDSLYSLLTKMNNAFSLVLKNISKLEKEKEFLTNQLEGMKEKIIQVSKPSDDSLLLPIATSSYNVFPNELTQIINSIANNDVLKTPTKVMKIFAAINDWYNNNYKGSIENNQRIKILQDYYDDFIKFIKKTFPEIKYDLSNLLNDKQLQNLIMETIQNMKTSNSELNDKLTELNNKMLNIFVALKSNNIDESFDKIMEIIKELDHEKKVNVKLQNFCKELKKSLNYNEKKNIKIKNKAEKELKEIFDQVNDYDKIVKTLQDNIAKAENDKKALIEQNQQRTNESNIAFESKISEFENRNKLMNDKILEMSKQLQEKNEKYLAIKKDYEKEKKANLALSNLVQQKEKYLQQVRLEKKKETSAFVSEKEINERKTQSVIEEYNEKISKLTKENSKVSQNVEQFKEKIYTLNMQIDDLTFKLRNSELKNCNLINDFERKNKLTESHYKTEMLSKETEYNSVIDSYKQKINEIKKNMIYLVASHFCILFNTNENLNEDNFDVFLKNISEKFKELIRQDISIRKLLHLDSKQSISEAISSMLLTIN